MSSPGSKKVGGGARKATAPSVKDHKSNVKQKRSKGKALEAYNNGLRTFPVPGSGNGSHAALLRVANLGVKAGVPPERIITDLEQSIPAGSKSIPLSDIEAAVQKAVDTSCKHGKASGVAGKTCKGNLPAINCPKKLKRKLIAESWGTQEANIMKISPVPIPPDARAQTLLVLSLYDDNDVLYLGDRYDKTVASAAEWKEKLSQPNAAIPELFCPNAFTGEQAETASGNMSYRADKCVKSFNYVVAEMDSTTSGRQLAFWKSLIKSGMPVVAITHSGNKSYHAIIAVSDIKNAEEWSERIENGLFRQYLEPLGVDGACKNEGRLTRLPGSTRADKNKQQRLIYFNPQAKGDPAEVIRQLNARLCPPRVMVKLPGSGATSGEFAVNLFSALSNSDAFFMCDEQIMMNENGRIKPLNADAAPINMESAVECGFDEKISEDSYEWRPKTASVSLVKSAFASMHRTALPEIKHVSRISMPYRAANGRLAFTEPGYDRAVKVFTSYEAPDVVLMPLEEAREVFFDIPKEFSFHEVEVDRARTLAYWLTPLLRLFFDGLAMGFRVAGNQPGIGKDTLLGEPSLIYHGEKAAFHSPCGSDDEWRKTLLSALRSGDDFFLVSNLKGSLGGQAIEQFMTSQRITGRILGRSETVTLENKMIYGFSDNGLALTPDIERRLMSIYLTDYSEDIASKRYSRDIVFHTLKNRERLLSCMYTFVSHWAYLGFPNGAVEILSFFSWSRVLSGFMNACGLGDPFAKRSISVPSMDEDGNTEDRCFRQLYLEWALKDGGAPKTAGELRMLACERDLFKWLDFAKHRDICGFGKMLTRRLGRIYAGMRVVSFGANNHKSYKLETCDQAAFQAAFAELSQDSATAGVSGVSGSMESIYTPEHFLRLKSAG